VDACNPARREENLFIFVPPLPPALYTPEPFDDDVIKHILRLRGKLGWQTVLPPHGYRAEETKATKIQKIALRRPLLLKDSGEYVYCLRRSRNNPKAPYNPYDLQVVSANTARHNKEYWTVTASFVSKVDRSRTYSLDEFCEEQYQQNKEALHQLQSFREKVIKAIQSTFLRKENPNYVEISEWRQMMKRFSRFLQLVDKIFQELLRKLVHNAVQLLLELFKGSSNVTNPYEKKNENLIRLLLAILVILTLLSILSSSMEQVESYSRNFMQYCAMVDEAKSMNMEILAIQRELSSHDFRGILNKYTDDVNEIICMTIERRIHMIKVRSVNYQTDCLPYFEMEEFIEHLTFLSQISSELPMLETQYNTLSQLYSIARAYDFPIPVEQFALYQNLTRSLHDLKSSILICEKGKNDNIIKFSADLDGYFGNLQFELRNFKNKVRNPVLLLSKTLPKTAKEMIQSLIEEATVISNKSKSYANYQDLFDGSIADMRSLSLDRMSQKSQVGDSSSQRVNKKLSEVESELALRKLLWDSLEEWGKLSFRWKHTLFENLDIDLIQKDVSRFMQTIQILEKDIMALLEESQVTISTIKGSCYVGPIKSQIMFNKDCTRSFQSSDPKMALTGIHDELVHHLEQLAEMTSDILQFHKQTTLEALLTLYIHCRDILSSLIDKQVFKMEDFEWTRQLRYEWNEMNATCRVVQGNASFIYGYEYLGCSSRLVITPLTDRCWLTLTGALHLNLGGCPAGPAGTGKTETVKDLSKFLLTVHGKEIRINTSCGIFITMNPGYKGRVELPDNLKSLFRPVSMMVPDYKLIAEVMLFSEGFKSAKSLSGKLVCLYQLACNQLSQQDHYDFGMRAIKTVLLRAGQKKKELKIQNYDTTVPAEEETLIIISSLKEANLPKFLAEDVSLFENIMADLFPGIIVPRVSTLKLEKAVTVAIQQLCLQPWASQIEKVLQFHNQILARVGVMLVGPTGGGKTTVRTILEKALVILPTLGLEKFSKNDKGKVDTFVINPKCVSVGELYGQTDPNTMEWSDGLLASAVRTFAKHSAKKSKKKESNNDAATRIQDAYTVSKAITDWQWIILDGPVDTVWIENLNTVLDDTRTLCLANSERIYLPSGIRMIFETDSLSQASPATVSRCAMVFVDPTDLGWEPYVKTWLLKVSRIITRSGSECLESLFEKSIKKGLNFLAKHKKMQPFPVQQMGIVMNLCRILGAFIDIMRKHGHFCHSEPDSTTFAHVEKEDQKWFLEKYPDKLPSLLEKLYVFAFTWVVGGVLRRETDYEEESLIGINTQDESLVNVTRGFSNFVLSISNFTGIQFPAGDRVIFEYFVDLQTGDFAPWTDLVPTTQFLIQQGKIPHETGDIAPSSERIKGVIVSTIQCGAHTSAAQIQAWIRQKLILKSKDTLGAPKSKQVIVFIDDLNMPIPEEYGAQPPLESIRQFLDLGGFYDTKQLAWKNIQNVSLVADCAPPSGGRNEISPRLLTHFCLLVLPQPSLQSLQRIFQVGLDGNGKITCATLACYLSNCSLFRLSVTHSYSYTDFTEDLKRVCIQTGLEGQNTVLLMTDSDIVQDSFLEHLSCILNSGEVLDLFDKEELEGIVVKLTAVAEKVNYSNGREAILSFFIVRSKLHIVLATSPAGLNFRQLCRIYPAIVNCSTVDWYDNWPEEALLHVAKSYFSHEDICDDSENLTNMVAQVCVEIHQSASTTTAKYLKETKRHYYITPNSYLQFIHTFSSILQNNAHCNLIFIFRACFYNGLTKLLEATSLVAEMQEELLALGPQIEQKSKEIEELVEKLHRDSLVVEQVRTLVKQDEEIMAEETKVVEEYAQKATEELNAVLPALEKALAALDALDKAHIAELRVYTHPPPLVLTVMNAVCILLQKKPSWATAKLLLADTGFLKKLVTLDKDNLPEKVFLQLKRYLRSPDFSPSKVGLVSIACCSMCHWILALDHYHEVQKLVKPKQIRVTEAQEVLRLAHQKLDEKQRSLALVSKWQNKGLPLDQYSIENAILVKIGQRWPLLIDPQKQAYKWICQMEGDRLRQIHASDSNYLRTLENAMRIGDSILLQTWRRRETTNPHFLPAVCNVVTMINFTVTFQGLQDQLLSTVVIHETPQLEQQRCELLESISADQITLRELEQKSLKLLQKTEGHILDDQDLIDNLQRTKVTSKEIFERVEASAKTEATIEKTRKNYLPIATRGAVLYFVVADLIKINYMYQFSLEWFHKIFVESMDSVNKLQSQISLSDSTSSVCGTSRHCLKYLLCVFSKYITLLVLTHIFPPLQTVSSALFTENQLCFSFLLCTKIMQNNCGENQAQDKLGFLPENEWNFFLYSSMLANIKDTQLELENYGSYMFNKTPCLWITESMWKECQYMSTHMQPFNLLCDSLASNSQQWSSFLNSGNLYYLLSTRYRPTSSQQAPSFFYQDFHRTFFVFRILLRVIVHTDSTLVHMCPIHVRSDYFRIAVSIGAVPIKILRPESLNSAIREFVIEKLGARYLQTGGINLKEVYGDSSASTPLIFIHSHDSLQDCRAYLESLPDTDSPELFGMHACAGRAFLESQAQTFIDTIVSMQPRMSMDTLIIRSSQDELVLEIASDILRQLPLTVEEQDTELTPGTEHSSKMKATLGSLLSGPIWAALTKAAKGHDPFINSALLTVLRQEIDRFNHLLSVITISLHSLQQAMKGEIIFTTGLEELYHSVLNSKVPEFWQLYSYMSNKSLGSWIDDLILRVNFFAAWANQAITCIQLRYNSLMMLQKEAKTSGISFSSPTDDRANISTNSIQGNPSRFWLSGFFFPQGFLTAVLQNYARQNGISVNSLTFGHRLLPTIHDEDCNLREVKGKQNIIQTAFKGSSPPENGVLVFGLYIDGARWSPTTHVLEEPFLHDRFYPETCPDEEQRGLMHYECPLYRTPQRAGILLSTGLSTNFVTTVSLPTLKPSSHWVTRGVATLCQLDD
uniref:Dynein axonemal heavy chain 14 n=1 Tax=Chelydra serpentina TaxID=8475 RepID=A0A8C3TFB6_CHESE